MRVSMEDDLPQHKSGTFGNVQTHAPRRFDDVMHVHFRVAVFSIKLRGKRRGRLPAGFNPKSSIVVISSFSAERNSFSAKACWPRNSMMLACFARFSCCFTTARRAFCWSSGRATSTALCAATSNAGPRFQRAKDRVSHLRAYRKRIRYFNFPRKSP